MLKITQIRKVQEDNNSCVHNYFYVVHARLYNSNKSRYYHFKYVIWIDTDDLYEEYGDEEVTEKMIKEYCEDIFYGIFCDIDYDDKDRVQNAIKICNESIEKYNDVWRRCAQRRC